MTSDCCEKLPVPVFNLHYDVGMPPPYTKLCYSRWRGRVVTNDVKHNLPRNQRVSEVITLSNSTARTFYVAITFAQLH